MKDDKIKKLNKKFYKHIAVGLAVTTLMLIMSYFIYDANMFEDLAFIKYLWIVPVICKVFWDSKRRKVRTKIIKEIKEEESILRLE